MMEEDEKSLLYNRVIRIENCLFGDPLNKSDHGMRSDVEQIKRCLYGDPNDKSDHGMRTDLRDLIDSVRGGGIAFRILSWLGGGIVSLWVAWDWIISHFPKATS